MLQYFLNRKNHYKQDSVVLYTKYNIIDTLYYLVQSVCDNIYRQILHQVLIDFYYHILFVSQCLEELSTRDFEVLLVDILVGWGRLGQLPSGGQWNPVMGGEVKLIHEAMGINITAVTSALPHALPQDAY